MSSDEDDSSFNDDNTTSNSVAFDITSAILFGNIDKDGNLTDDIFDEECKRQLTSLQPHLNSVVSYETLIGGDEKSSDKNSVENENDDSNDIFKEDEENSDGICK